MLSDAFLFDIQETNVTVDGNTIQFKNSKLGKLIDEDMDFKKLFTQRYIIPLQSRIDKAKTIELSDAEKSKLEELEKEKLDLISMGSRLEHIAKELSRFIISHSYYIVVCRNMYKDFLDYGIIDADGSCEIDKRVFKEQKDVIEKHFGNLKELTEYYKLKK